MELVLRILRRCAAVLNGVCVLAVLALLVPAVTLRAAAEWQNTENPVFRGYTVAVVTEETTAPLPPKDSLVLLKQSEKYILDDLAACRLDGETVFGIVLAARGDNFDLGIPQEKQVLAAGVPLDQMLGHVQGSVPHYGGWLSFAQTDRGLLTLVAAGVVLVELPAFLRPRKKKKASEADTAPEEK